MRLPEERRWLFWESEFDGIDSEMDADYVLARVLEFGQLADVLWLIRTYGNERIHGFFRRSGHPELSARTIAFWRAFFDAEDESWATPPSWRTNSSAPWPG